MVANCRAIGIGVIGLGGGRLRTDDKIDHAVGYSNLVPMGTKVDAGDPIARVHAQSEDAAKAASAALISAYEFASDAPVERPIVGKRITATG